MKSDRNTLAVNRSNNKKKKKEGRKRDTRNKRVSQSKKLQLTFKVSLKST